MPILINSSNRPQGISPGNVTQSQPGALDATRKSGDPAPVRDSAAMLAINHRISSQIRGINQALTRSNDAISMIQVADHAMNEVEGRLNQLGDSARKAAQPQLGAEQKASLHQQAQRVHAEIRSLLEESAYDDVPLLKGGKLDQVPAGTGEQNLRSIAFPDLSSLADPPDLSSPEGAQRQIEAVRQGQETIAGARVALAGHHEALAKGLKELTAAAKSLTSAESRAADTSLAEGIASQVSSFLRQSSGHGLQQSLPAEGSSSLNLLQPG